MINFNLVNEILNQAISRGDRKILLNSLKTDITPDDIQSFKSIHRLFYVSYDNSIKIEPKVRFFHRSRLGYRNS